MRAAQRRCARRCGGHCFTCPNSLTYTRRPLVPNLEGIMVHSPRGLRPTGSVPIPREMWRRHAPTNWAWVAAHMPPVGASKGATTEALA